MPPIRRVLGEISGNQPRRKDLTPNERGLTIWRHRFGAKEAAIMDEFKVSCGAVRSTIAHGATRPQGESQPRTGGPITYDDRD